MSMPVLDDEFNFNDINLDFLGSPPRVTRVIEHDTKVEHIAVPLFDSPTKFYRNEEHKPNIIQYSCNARPSLQELSKRIADVDSLVCEIRRTEVERDGLRKQLEEFRQSAQEVQALYAEEKRQHIEEKLKNVDLFRRFQDLDTELTNKTLENDQLQAQICSLKGPIEYNDLVVKYLKLIQKSEDQIHWQEAAIVKDLQKYCKENHIKIPQLNVQRSPRKPKISIAKIDAEIQCNMGLKTTTAGPTVDQSTQCEKIEMRNQGCQHIGTTTTRSTTTACFIKFHDVGVNCNLFDFNSALNEMLNDMHSWSRLTAPLSPIADLHQNSDDLLPQLQLSPLTIPSLPSPSPSPPPPDPLPVKELKTIGTCTMLCNVQRLIDYATQLPIIKRSDSRPPSRAMLDTVKDESNSTTQSTMSSSLRLDQNGGEQGVPMPSQFIPSAFDELWQIFGHMLYGLLQRRVGNNAPFNNQNFASGIATNQQDFHNWLQALYLDITFERAQQNRDLETQRTGGESSGVQTNHEGSITTEILTPVQGLNQSNLASPLTFSNAAPIKGSSPGQMLIKPKAQRSDEVSTTNCGERHSIGTSPIRCIVSSPTLSIQKDINSSFEYNDENKSPSAFSPPKPINSNSSEEEVSETAEKILELFPSVVNRNKILQSLEKLLHKSSKSSSKKTNLKKSKFKRRSKSVVNVNNETGVDFISKLSSINGKPPPDDEATGVRGDENQLANMEIDKNNGIKTKKRAVLDRRKRKNIQIRNLFGSDTDSNDEEIKGTSILENQIRKKMDTIQQTDSYSCSSSDDSMNFNESNFGREENTATNANENEWDELECLSMSEESQNTEDELEAVCNQELKNCDQHTLSSNKNTNKICENPDDISFNSENSKIQINTDSLENVSSVTSCGGRTTENHVPTKNILNKESRSSDEEMNFLAKQGLGEKSGRNSTPSNEIGEKRVRNSTPSDEIGEKKGRNSTPSDEMGEKRGRNSTPSNEIGEKRGRNSTPPNEMGEKRVRNSTPSNEMGEERGRNSTPSNEIGEKRVRNSTPSDEMGEKRGRNSTPSNEIGEKRVINSTPSNEIGVERGRNSTPSNEIGEKRVRNSTPSDEMGEKSGRNSTPSDEMGEKRGRNSTPSNEIGEKRVRNSTPSNEIGEKKGRNSTPSDEIGEKKGRNSTPSDEMGEKRGRNSTPSNEIGEKRGRNSTPPNEMGEKRVRNSTPSNEMGEKRVKNSTPPNEMGEKRVRNSTPSDEIVEKRVRNSTPSDEIGEKRGRNSTPSDEIGEKRVINSTPSNEIGEERGRNSTPPNEMGEKRVRNSTPSNEMGEERGRNSTPPNEMGEKRVRNSTPSNEMGSPKTQNDVGRIAAKDSETDEEIFGNEDVLLCPMKTSERNIHTLSPLSDSSTSSYESKLVVVCENEDLKGFEFIPLNSKKLGRKRKISSSSSLSLTNTISTTPCKRSARLLAKRKFREQQELKYNSTIYTLANYTRPYEEKEAAVESKSDQKNNTKEECIECTPVPVLGYFQEIEEAVEENSNNNESEMLLNNHDENKEGSSNADDPKKSILIESNRKLIPSDNRASTAPPPPHGITSPNEFVESSQIKFSSPPASPTPIDNNIIINDLQIKLIPLERDEEIFGKRKRTLLSKLIGSYTAYNYRPISNSNLINDHENEEEIGQLEKLINDYLALNFENVAEDAAVQLVTEMLKISKNLKFIAQAICTRIEEESRPPRTPYENLKIMETPILDQVPTSCVHQKMPNLLKQLIQNHCEFTQMLLHQIESILFNIQNADTIPVNAALNLTDLYLLTLTLTPDNITPQLMENPARLFIAKCLFYHKVKAIPMIYTVLCVFPSVLPHREEDNYDRSDALITVIQHTLMCTQYDMDNYELFHREILSKLRFVYRFEIYKPDFQHVLQNLMEKLRSGKFNNLKYAFAIFCKRLQPDRVINDIIQPHLMPITNEFYSSLQQTTDYDERTAVLLDCFSCIIKPFPRETTSPIAAEINNYLNIFKRFLSIVERPIVQEAAVHAILRLQRFSYINCYNALANYCPDYELKPQTRAALRTFIHRKSNSFWKTMLNQSGSTSCK